MKHQNFTPIPNALLDRYLKDLRPVELKVLLTVLRQTRGWHKQRDWMTIGYLVKRTGASRRALSVALDSLMHKKIINITDESGNSLVSANDRKGKRRLFFSFRDLFAASEPAQKLRIKPPTSAEIALEPEQKCHITKETITKGYAQKVRRELVELGILSQTE